MDNSRGIPTVVSKSNRIAPPWLWLVFICMACALGAYRYHLIRNAPINEAELANEAAARAITALDGLGKKFDGPELVSALNLGVINFATGSADIPQERFPLLDSSAKAIKRAPAGTLLEIEGHADITGDEARNVELSLSRARSIAYYLVRKGVDPKIVVARGYGSHKPVADNTTPVGRFQNRRIEYRIR